MSQQAHTKMVVRVGIRLLASGVAQKRLDPQRLAAKERASQSQGSGILATGFWGVALALMSGQGAGNTTKL